MTRNLLMLAALLAVAPPVLAQDGGRKLTATLTGAAEVPNPGDPDGTGTAVIRINPGQERLCFTLQVVGIDPARAAHIHRGAPGVAGPVVVPLAPPTAGTSEGCITVTRELAQQLIRDPASFYVNIHNAPFPTGALRGQLGR